MNICCTCLTISIGCTGTGVIKSRFESSLEMVRMLKIDQYGASLSANGDSLINDRLLVLGAKLDRFGRTNAFFDH
jgi:hypothetical protein